MSGWNVDSRRTLSVKQAAEAAGACRRTIYNWMRKGKVEFKFTAGGSPRIYEDTLPRRGAIAVETSAR